MTRTTKRDWLDAGMAVLADAGPTGLTIDAMCTRLDVTKGSFHHHFDGYEDFKTRLLHHFERDGTLEIIETVDREPTPEARLRRLLEVVAEYSRRNETDPEAAVRAWARHDDAVREVQRRVDQRRLEYIQSLLRDLGGDESAARRRARLLYATIVGCEQLYPQIRGDDLEGLFEEFLELYSIEPAGREGGERR